MTPEIEITSGTDRETQKQQLKRIIAATRDEQGEDIRLRMPLTISDPATRQYTQVRDAFWNVKLPAAVTVEHVQEIIQALDAAITAVGTLGAQEVIARLTREGTSE